jgi:RND family efflux transporter MFP subunit
MTQVRQTFQWKVCAGIIALAVVGLVSGSTYITMRRSNQSSQGDKSALKSKGIPVRFTHAKKGVLERLSTQPGSIQAYESVNLYAKVAGFLKKQNVDIGDHVEKNQILAVVDVPELEAQAERSRAGLDHARSQVLQMKARVNSAEADLDAAKSAVVQAEATAKSSAAWVRYRALQHKRMKDLFVTKSIEEKLVDESKERYEASVETELAAKAAIVTTKSKVVAAGAKIRAAQADVAEAEADVRVMQAELRKAEVQLSFATIAAPFDGVVSFRSMFPGDFVQSANQGGAHEPLLTVQRTDLMRVVVQVPDRDIPYTQKGDSATVEIDALPGKKLTATVSRIAQSEDPQTRLMRVEIDLPNPSGKIVHGMYGKVTIVLDRSTDELSIRSSCLVGKEEDGVGAVYVIRDKQARLVNVQLGLDNGLRVAVVSGLSADDKVILQPGNGLSEGVLVNATAADDESGKANANR